jgi:hypothetical protein
MLHVVTLSILTKSRREVLLVESAIVRYAWFSVGTSDLFRCRPEQWGYLSSGCPNAILSLALDTLNAAIRTQKGQLWYLVLLLYVPHVFHYVITPWQNLNYIFFVIFMQEREA